MFKKHGITVVYTVNSERFVYLTGKIAGEQVFIALLSLWATGKLSAVCVCVLLIYLTRVSLVIHQWSKSFLYNWVTVPPPGATERHKRERESRVRVQAW